MTPPVRMIELAREEVRRRAPDAVAVVPVGACEQHGPHLPLGTDLLIVDHVATAAAALADEVDVIVAPAVPVGYSAHHLPVGPTLTLEPQTVHDVVSQMCDGLVRAGFRRLFILNGHGGNAELLVVTARTVGQRHNVLSAAGSYWAMAWDSLIDQGAQEEGRLPGHAGAFETSLIAALRPELVRDPPRSTAPFAPNPGGYFRPVHIEDAAAWTATSGFTDNPAAGSAAAGERYLTAIVAAVSEALSDLAQRQPTRMSET